MREIKFKYLFSDGRNFLEPSYFTLDQIEAGDQFDVLNNEPLLKNYKCIARLEFTGLYDKNNLPIYEGDIISIPMGLSGNNIGVVKFGSYRAGGLDYYSQRAYGFYGESITEEGNDLNLQYDDIEIIGNIYEHKHLLEDK